MLLLPPNLRDNLMKYIQANPSPNVPVGQCMQLLAELQNLKKFGRSPAAVPEPEEGPAQPGAEEKEESGVVNG